jgi:hypothetical protein
VVAITKCKLGLGPWEQIFYGKFDCQFSGGEKFRRLGDE